MFCSGLSLHDNPLHVKTLPVVTENNTDLATSKLIDELGAIVQTKPQELYEASFDGLKVQGETGACILAKEDEHVGKVLRIANEYGIPITTKGAGSSLTGGATPIRGGWVLDLSNLDDLFLDEKNRLVRCGPGVVVSTLQAEAEKLGLFYPPDPSSKSSVRSEGMWPVMQGV